MFATMLAAAVLSITTPAAAGGAPAAAAPTAAPAPASAPAAAATYNPRVCLVDQVTGSYIRRRECRLLSQWRTAGIDPLPGK